MRLHKESWAYDVRFNVEGLEVCRVQGLGGRFRVAKQLENQTGHQVFHRGWCSTKCNVQAGIITRFPGIP